MFVPFWGKIRSDTDFRIKAFLLLSLVCNLAYASFLFFVSQRDSSQWFLVISIYYGLLSIVRIFIFAQINLKNVVRRKIMTLRISGFFLVFFNIVVSVMMFLLIYTAPCVKHHEITVIAIATYTFSSLIIAIISSVKYLKENHYLYFSVKMISLISASVSMVTLTNTMLATWGEGDMLLRNIILPILSGAVSIFIIVSAVLMIKKSDFDLRILKDEEKGE